MQEDDAVQLAAALVSVWFVAKPNACRQQNTTYVTRRKSEINITISASLLTVSSNPGVSMNVTIRLSSMNGEPIWTSDVQDCRPSLTGSLESLARLMNCKVERSTYQPR